MLLVDCTYQIIISSVCVRPYTNLCCSCVVRYGNALAASVFFKNSECLFSGSDVNKPLISVSFIYTLVAFSPSVWCEENSCTGKCDRSCCLQTESRKEVYIPQFLFLTLSQWTQLSNILLPLLILVIQASEFSLRNQWSKVPNVFLPISLCSLSNFVCKYKQHISLPPTY